MPYNIYEENGQYCVYKHDEEGHKVGKTHGCHDTRKEALAQMRALYAAEEKAIDMGQELKMVEKSEGDGKHPASHYLVVEDPEKPTTWHLRVKDTSGKVDTRLLGAAHAALTKGYRGNKYEGPDKEKALSKLRGLYKEAGLDWPEDKKSFDLKMYGMDEDDYIFVPWGVTTMADAVAAQEAQESIKEISCLVCMFTQVMDHILSDVTITDKKAAIGEAAGELADMVNESASGAGDEEKAVTTLPIVESATGKDNAQGEYVNTGVTEDHRHKVMGDVTTEQNGHKHAVVDGKVQEADGHTHELTTEEVIGKSLLNIKSLGGGRVGSYAVLWGSENKRDLTQEYFDEKTEELTAIFDVVGKLPYIYHHTMDDTLKTRVIGVVDTLRPDSVGLWYEAQLKLADEYDKYVKKMLEDKRLKTSTQTFNISRRVAKSGHIERWPIVEITATPTPAEYRMPAIEFVKSAYQEIGCSDFSCVMKKIGVEVEGGQGAEKARLLAELDLARLELEFV